VMVRGALEAIRYTPGAFKLLFVGDRELIAPIVEREGVSDIEIVHASEVIGMSEPPANVVRKKKDSSIAVGTRLVKEGRADSFVSAGNTGAVVASSLVTLGRLHGVSRPAISSLWPNKGSGAVVLDVGANRECTAKNLLQFGVMGSVFAKYHIGVAIPRVGLLNIGEEKSKGNEVVREAYGLLENESAINFIGNVEGRDVFDGAADVVVCDGFVGNVILKFSESIYSFLAHLVRDEISKGMVAKGGAFLMKGVFKSVRSQLDYATVGGAPLLGVKGVTIIAHGKSSERAITNAVRAAVKSVRTEINMHIEELFRESVGNVSNKS